MRGWKGYSHGIDLGGWLSQCDHTKERYENFIVKDDIKRISEWGLDHVRLPVDYEVADGAPEYIDRCLEWCREYGLNMVLDLHKTYGYSFDKGKVNAASLNLKNIRKNSTVYGRSFLKDIRMLKKVLPLSFLMRLQKRNTAMHGTAYLRNA